MSPHPVLLHDAQGGGFGLEPKAKPEITVMIEGVVTCKECRRRMVQTRTLAYSCVELATIDIVKYARDEVNAALEEEARKRGWDDRCGRCKDPEHQLVNGPVGTETIGTSGLGRSPAVPAPVNRVEMIAGKK